MDDNTQKPEFPYKREVLLREGERIDDLERNGLGIIQNKNGFCFGMDAVLLSGFASVKKGGTAVDLGTGTGIIPLLLSAKTEAKRIYGVELQEEVAQMALRSVALNELEEKISIINGDVREYRSLFKELLGQVDTVTSNPPYMKAGNGLQNPDLKKSISRHEIYLKLPELCEAAAGLLRSGGRFCMVHRPLRLPEIMQELSHKRLEPKRIAFVHPYIDREANMVLIEAVKDGRGECHVERPIIVFNEDGSYSRDIKEIYAY